MNLKSFPWPGMVFALLGLNVGVVAATIFAANSRKATFAVEPNYDTRALNWDRARDEARRGLELGWTVVPEPRPGSVLVTVLGPDGTPLTGAEVVVTAFHHARAGGRRSARCTPDGDAYACPLTLAPPGLWQITVDVTKDQSSYSTTITRAVTVLTTTP